MKNLEELKSLPYGSIVYHESYGKLYFRKFVEQDPLEHKGQFVVTSPDEASLKVSDEGYLSCHGLMHWYFASDIYPTEEAMLTAIASKLQNKLEAIADEATKHNKELQQMMFWLQFPEIQSFYLHDEPYTFFVTEFTKEDSYSEELVKFLTRINLDYDEYKEQFCENYPMIGGFESGRNEFKKNTYSRPTDAAIADYITKQRSNRSYQNFTVR